MAVDLRRMTNSDLPQVEGIQGRIMRGPVSQRWKEMLAKHVGEPDNAGFVAEKDGRVIGFILGEIKIGEFGSDTSGWIEMAGVEPEMMGQGIGRSLAEALFEHFKQQGVMDVFTSVRWDSGDMLAFFKNLGFDRSEFINLHRHLKS